MSAFERTFDVGKECAVTVETTSGDVVIRGWDKPAAAVRSSDGEPKVWEEGAMLDVKAPSGGSGDLTVYMPHQCDLTLRLVSGDAELYDVGGQISIQTMSGDVDARQLRGDLRLHTVSGDISVRASQLGSLTMDAVSGDSTIESALEEGGDYRLHTVSGAVRLLLPEDQGCVVTFHSLSGDFKCGLPHTVSHQGWGKLIATVNRGGVELYVRTTSGDLSIGAAGQLPEAKHAQPKEEAAPVERATRPLASQQPEAEPFRLDENQPAASAQEPKPVAAQRMEILKAIEEGRMTVSEGLAKLRALE